MEVPKISLSILIIEVEKEVETNEIDMNQISVLQTSVKHLIMFVGGRSTIPPSLIKSDSLRTNST